jgi:hypothetical protein
MGLYEQYAVGGKQYAVHGVRIEGHGLRVTVKKNR